MVSRTSSNVVRFRLRATVAQRRGAYLSLVLVLGLVGGVALGSLAGARRTASSFDVFLASTHPSDFNFLGGLYDPASAATSAFGRGYDPALIRAVARLPDVARVTSYAGLIYSPLVNGAPRGTGSVLTEGSVDGEFFTRDRVTVVQGRLANPRDPHEVMVSEELARVVWGAHRLPTTSFPLGFYTPAQQAEPAFGTAKVRPAFTVMVHAVAIVKYNDTVVEDDVDASPTGRILVTPALTRRALSCCVADTASYVTLRDPHAVGRVERAIERLMPRGVSPLFFTTSAFTGKARQTIEPEAVALAVFGTIAGLVAILLAALVIGRTLESGAAERRVLRALGADPSTMVADDLAGIAGALVVGAVLAALVALALSPLAPLGPVRAYYPGRGLSFDAPVVAGGAIGLALLAGAWAALRSVRAAPHRVAGRRPGPTRPGVSRVGSALPAAARTGVRFALDAGSGSSAVPVKSAIGGVVLAVAVIAGTLTFGASLNALVSHPRLYGWNWDVELSSNGFGYSDIPDGALRAQLGADHSVAAWTGVSFGELPIDGVTLPVIGLRPGASVQPPVLSGHDVRAPGQVVLGAATLALLHKRVGDTVAIGLAPSRRVTIVGTATLPTVGQAGSLHTTMGTGAVLDARLIPLASRNPFHSSVFGPQAVWIRFAPGVDGTAARRELAALANTPRLATDGTVTVLDVQRPAQIVNYRSMGATPALLGSALAAGAVVALGLTLIASVRRRRRDLAILKALGFTQRQLATTVAWQSSVAVVGGTVVGLPLGIVAGRLLWDQFARAIHVVPAPSVPMLTMLLVAAGAFVLGNLVAFVPGRSAARTPTALLLSAE